MISLELRKLQAEEGLRKNGERILGAELAAKAATDFVGTQFTSTRYGSALWTALGLNRRIRKLPVVAVDSKDRVRWFTLDEVNTGKVDPSNP